MERKELTRVEKCELLKGVVVGHEMESELVEFLDKLIEGFSKKRTAKVSETDTEIMDLIYEAAKRVGEIVTVSEILKDEAVRAYTYKDKEETKTITGSKVTAMIKKMADRFEKDEEASTAKVAKYRVK